MVVKIYKPSWQRIQKHNLNQDQLQMPSWILMPYILKLISLKALKIPGNPENKMNGQEIRLILYD